MSKTKTSCERQAALTDTKVSAVTATATRTVSFLLDTGADKHVAADKHDFISYTSRRSTCELADGTSTQVLGYGEITVPTTQPGSLLRLKNAIHMPGVTETILSLIQLEDEGFHLHCPADTSLPKELRRADHSVVLTFTRIHKKYLWRPLPSSTVPDWHAALGHINPRSLKKTLDHHNIPCLIEPSHY